MTQVAALYELYRHLPKKSRVAFKELIENEEIVEVHLEGIVQGLKEVKDIKLGKLPRQTFAEFKVKIKNGK